MRLLPRLWPADPTAPTPREIPVTWPSVEAAIAAAYSDHGLRAIDPEAMAQRVSSQRPNPGRVVTVRRTGSEGGYSVREPIRVIECGRVRGIVEELPDLVQCVVRARAQGASIRACRAAARKGFTCSDGAFRRFHFDDKVVASLVHNGLEWVRLRLVRMELVEAA